MAIFFKLYEPRENKEEDGRNDAPLGNELAASTPHAPEVKIIVPTEPLQALFESRAEGGHVVPPSTPSVLPGSPLTRISPVDVAFFLKSPSSPTPQVEEVALK